MKKSFVALAVLGAFAGTSMAAEVTMYGVVDTGLLYQHGEASASIDGIGSASAEVDSFSMEPGTNSASRFGIRGTEDLGNGMTVGFKLENGFESGTGALKTDSKLFDRESTLFIKGGFGTVYAGRMGTLVSDAGSVGFTAPWPPLWPRAGPTTSPATTPSWPTTRAAMTTRSPTFRRNSPA